MAINFKKLLLTGTALVAATYAAQAQAATVNISGADQLLIATDPAATPAVTFTTDHIASFNDGVNITTGPITAGTTNFGTLTLLGSSTIQGAVGVNGANLVKAINAGITGKTVTFSSTVDATTLNVTGTGTVNLTGNSGIVTLAFGTNDGVVNVSSGKNLTVTNVTNGAASTGTLNFLGGAQAVGGAIGNTTNKIKLITSGVGVGDVTTFGGAIKSATITNGAGTSTFTGQLTQVDTLNVGTGTVNINNASANVATAVSFAGNDGVLSFGAGADLTGSIDATTASKGTVTFVGESEISGTIGATAAVKVLNAGANGTTSKVAGLVKATTTNITGTGTLQLNGAGANVTAAVFGADGKLTLGAGANLTGTVTTGTTNTGTLSLAGSSTISGAVGGTNALLKLVEVGADGSTSVFSGAVTATKVAATGTGSTTFSEGVAGAIDFANKASTIVIASGKTVTGAIDSTGGAAASVLTLSGGTQTIAGAVGGTNAIGTVNAGQAAGTTNFSSAVKATTLSVGTGTVNLAENLTGALTFASAGGTTNVAAGKNITGNISGTGGSKGTLNFAGSSALVGTVGAGAATLSALTLNGTGTTVTVNGATVAANTTDVNGNTLAVTGTFTIAAGQTLSADITGAATSGKVTSSAAATVDADTILSVNVNTGAYIANNQNFTIIDGTGGGGVATLNAGKIVDDSALLSFTQVADADNLVIKAVRAAINTVSATANGQTVGAVLDSAGITGSGDATMQAILGNVSGAASASALDSVLSSVTPTVDGGATTAAVDATVAVQGINETRLAALRSGDGETGMAAGQNYDGAGMWVQIHGQAAEQDTRGGIAGYDADSLGGVIGFDTTRIASDTTLGVALSYTFTNVDSNNANTTETDIGSYGLTFYGNRELGNDVFVSGQLGYAYNDIDSERHNVGGAGVTASGDYHSSQYSAKVAVGRDYTSQPGLLITPTASVSYMLLDTSSYTESGAGGGNLNVDSDTISALDLGLGVNAGWKLKVGMDGAILKPSVHAGVTYDALGQNVETTSTFTAGGAAFKTEGFDPARVSGNAGAGLSYSAGENWDLSANYDYELKSDYDAHSGYLRATTRF